MIKTIKRYSSTTVVNQIFKTRKNTDLCVLDESGNQDLLIKMQCMYPANHQKGCMHIPVCKEIIFVGHFRDKAGMQIRIVPEKLWAVYVWGCIELHGIIIMI